MNTTSFLPHCIIVGGTSGIGLALANHHLKEGWSVTVIGSNPKKISALAHHKPDTLHLECCDITDTQALDALLGRLAQRPFLRLIYCAGWYLNERKHRLNTTDSTKMLAINLQAFHTIFAWASHHLKAQSTTPYVPHLIAIASVAGLLNYQDASLYAKCKSAMIANCQAYALALTPFGIAVTCIACGYVDTEQLRALNRGNANHKPFVVSEQTAVLEICNAITQQKQLHIFPKPMKYLTTILSLLPKPLLNTLMTWQYRHQDAHRP
ncbi:MAG: SDR family oxidoreductase [Moraxella sp.]|nr:SDR family oxidoreductase [Moraxella sp.]